MPSHDRLHALDAVRAFALLLGVLFHAGFSFIPGMIPGIWAIVDNSPSTTMSTWLFAAHIFRMSLFFFVAGFFARLLYVRSGARGFWANRARRILGPLVVGWLVIFPMLAAVWIWGLTKTFGGTLPSGPPPPSPPGAFPLTHLWFLYYLFVLYVIVVSLRKVVVTIDRGGAIRRAVDAAVRGIVTSGFSPIALALPLSIALYLRADWIAWFGIPTPDQSVIPQAASLIGYGTAVAFGWLVHRQTDLLEAFARRWQVYLIAAVATTAVCLTIVGLTPAFVPMPATPQKFVYALAYAVAIWCWSFAVIGAATRYLADHNARVRYVADASYWIYIVHLPVVAAMQVVVGHWPLHWTIKFPLVVAVSLAILFASYRFMVRSTFIGQFLNGRRYPKQGTVAEAAASPTSGAVLRSSH